MKRQYWVPVPKHLVDRAEEMVRLLGGWAVGRPPAQSLFATLLRVQDSRDWETFGIAGARGNVLATWTPDTDRVSYGTVGADGVLRYPDDVRAPPLYSRST